MSFGSQQLRLFRRARRDGMSVADAADTAGMSIGEAELHAKRDASNPPPTEAYELLYDSAGAAVEQAKETIMMKAAKKEDGEGAGISGEYKRPDAARAFEIYDKQIKPKKAHLATLRGDLSDPYALLKDECHFPRTVLDFIVKLDGMEDAKRDHFLLALSEGLKERKLFLPTDLVTMANGEDGGDVVPSGSRPKPQLATLGGAPVAASVSADDGPDDDEDTEDEDDFEEASEDELAGQVSRPSAEQAKADEEAALEAAAAE